jgi:lysine 2,3-aminomutase
MVDISRYTPEYLKSVAPEIFNIALKAPSLSSMRKSLSHFALKMMYETFHYYDDFTEVSIIRVRDCANSLIKILTRRSEHKAGFSLVKALRDIAKDRPRPDLTPAFYAELLHIFTGLQGRGQEKSLSDSLLSPTKLKGRNAARYRSRQLNGLEAEVRVRVKKYRDGLQQKIINKRLINRSRILSFFKASEKSWFNWQWQVNHILRNPDDIAQLISLSSDEKEAIVQTQQRSIPFGITPYYLSLMDYKAGSKYDQAIRAQVIPPLSYVRRMSGKDYGDDCFDFMKEADTSPIDLITRRYPEICIFKPFNTCPQICVYCQRNWEIKNAMEPGALAPPKQLDSALKWIREHPAIHEVLVTGGDPFAMPDLELSNILGRVAAISTIERIRIGTRTLVTMPMRFTKALLDILRKLRVPSRRQVAVVTHVQHPYEVTQELAKAVENLRLNGIPVYNQLVYTFYVSRRFEASHLRRLLSRVGIEPYYTFNTKGKEETSAYRVPIARLLQEQKEEARMLPGITRSDEAVYNVPGLGKNYLRARNHSDLIAILPNGARIYEFHPWEKQISSQITTYIKEDVSILDYLTRLDNIGEDISDYQTIWYYF